MLSIIVVCQKITELYGAETVLSSNTKHGHDVNRRTDRQRTDIQGDPISTTLFPGGINRPVLKR